MLYSWLLSRLSGTNLMANWPLRLVSSGGSCVSVQSEKQVKLYLVVLPFEISPHVWSG
jgi:hypothetical protein